MSRSAARDGRTEVVVSGLAQGVPVKAIAFADANNGSIDTPEGVWTTTNGGTTGSTCGASGSDISSNHAHALTIPKADLDSLTAKTYDLSAGSFDAHIHSVTFSVPQLATLKGGGSVTVTSTTNPSSYHLPHGHSVMATVTIATCA